MHLWYFLVEIGLVLYVGLCTKIYITTMVYSYYAVQNRSVYSNGVVLSLQSLSL